MHREYNLSGSAKGQFVSGSISGSITSGSITLMSGS